MIPAGGGGRAGVLEHLARGWGVLHLSVQTPERIPGWDVVVLTAASERQARIYELQIEAARRHGLIGQRTRTLVAADPGGVRIGSGGATLNALRRLAEVMPRADLRKARVLLIHAGGDSRRAPWANIFGKCFVPLPLLADPDRAVPTLFDHQLAVCAPLAMRLTEGGLVSLSGDVLPLFAAGRAAVPADGGVIVTTPASLDVAEKHGVIVADRDGRVVDLLQKRPAEDLIGRGALTGGGAALLDTGVCGFAGAAFGALVDLALSDPDPVAVVQEADDALSLYEEIAGACVAHRHGWVRSRPLGERLVAGLRDVTLWHHRADEFMFVHFGTSAEVLAHLAHPWAGGLCRRILCECGAEVGLTSVVCVSDLDRRAAVGRGSFIYGCRLGDGVSVGNRCVVLGVEAGDEPCRIPDNTCIWQVPLAGGAAEDGPVTVTACCGVDDNPKDGFRDATFCNRRMTGWMAAREVPAEALWRDGEPRDLWHARLFPEGSRADGMAAALWMAGAVPEPDAARIGAVWRERPRVSLAELHARVDAEAFARHFEEVAARRVIRVARRAVSEGLERNVHALGSQLTVEAAGAALADLAPASGRAPETATSRELQTVSDLLGVLGRAGAARHYSEAAFRAVQREVAAAVMPYRPEPVGGLAAGRVETVLLPVRFDLAGGWSDTPPYCLERPARVLNMAMRLNGELPVGARVEALERPEWQLVLDDSGERMTVHDGESLEGGEGLRDAFTLPRTALALTGFGAGRRITQGVRVSTWARVPRGSGLGTSSILGAALIRALQRLAGRPDDVRTVNDLVLLLEQRMTTGGGWQDQIGGLVPGVKCAATAPVRPMRVMVETIPLLPGIVDELEARFVLAFTGGERLAKNVLQIVVERYLRREWRVLAAIAGLVELADEGQQALALGDLDRAGEVMNEVWRLHQDLDPHCSNPGVD
ncbi:MAG: hypothetical protein JW951_02240, partial [Lentisphaerae bacterium]|nr:hypothetical protein [Lentisphaerota bacterium]